MQSTVPPRHSNTVMVLALLVSTLVSLALAAPAIAWRQPEPPATPLSGEYSVTIGREDVPADIADGAALAGQWSLSLGEDGTFHLNRRDVGQVVTGAFDTGPATLTFTDWSGIVGCELPGQNGAAATYAWRQVDDLLTLTALDDACLERLTLLTTHPLGRVDACEIGSPVEREPFAAAGTPVPEGSAPPAGGVAAQEGFGQGGDVEAAIDELLRSAGGCWATADPDRFMMLHSQGLRGQIAMMGPPEAFNQELRDFMETPLGFERIGEATVVDPTHAWSYVEVNLGGEPTPQRVNFVLEDGAWRFDSFALFGPPIAGEPAASGS